MRHRLVRSCGDETGDRLGIRAVAGKQLRHARRGKAALRGDTRKPDRRIGRKRPPAADSPVGGCHVTAAAQPFQRHVGCHFSERAKRRPFAADHAQHRWATIRRFDDRAEMVARNAAGKAVIAGRKRPHAGKLEDDLVGA